MSALLRVVAAMASVFIATACGVANAAEGIPSYSPGAQSPEASFTFEAEAGAHPVDGRSGEWVAPDSEIRVWEYENIVKVDAADTTGFDHIWVELNGPGGAPLQVGHYPDARNRDLAPDSPGMLVISNGLGCVDEYGEFTVDRIERDATGQLVAFDASFTHRCHGPDRPTMYGWIHFQS